MSISIRVETESGTQIEAQIDGQQTASGKQSSTTQESLIVGHLRQGIVEKEGTELDYQKGRHDARNGDISERNKTIQYEIGYNKALQDQARNKPISDSYTQQQKDIEIAKYENKINQKRKELAFNKDRVEIHKSLLEKIDGTEYLVRMMSVEERNTYMNGSSLKTDLSAADLKEAFGQNQKIKPEPQRFFSLDDRYRFSTADKNSPDNSNYAHVVIVKMNDALRSYLKESLVPSDFPGGIPGPIRNNPRIKLETAQGRVDGQVTVGIPMAAWNDFTNKFKDSAKDESASWNFVSRDEVDDHLAFAKINKKGFESPDFVFGWNNPDYEKVPITGYNENMSVLEMKRLAKNLPANSIELGVLAHRIHDKEFGINKVSKAVQTDPEIINRPLKLENLFKKYLQDMAEIFSYNLLESPKHRLSGQDGSLMLGNDSNQITRASTDTNLKGLAANMLSSLKKLHLDNKLTAYYVPDFSSVKRLPEGNFQVKLIDSKSSSSVFVTTDDESFMRVKDSLNKKQSITRGAKAGKFNIPPGLSFYFLLKALYNTPTKSDNDRLQIDQLSATLAATFRLHGYVNMTSLGSGVTQDVVATSRMVYQQVSNFIDATKSVSSNSKLPEHALFKLAASAVDKISASDKTLRLLNKGLKGLFIADTVLSGVSIWFSAQEFINAQNDVQRKVFALQLGFDVAGFALSAGALYAFSVGAFGLAATLGLLGIPLAAIGYGVVEVVKYYASLEDRVKNDVVAYFNEAKVNYRDKRGYVYDAQTGLVRLLSKVVFEEVDLETGQITFGSQRVRGRDNKQKDRVSNDDPNPTSLRDAFGVTSTTFMDDLAKNASIINLPDTPQSDISYTMEHLSALNKYKGEEYSIVEEVENHSGQKFELENINSLLESSTVINKLHHIYDANAKFTLKLGSLSRVIVVPKTLPRTTTKVTLESLTQKEIWESKLPSNATRLIHTEECLLNAISYKLIGKGGTYTIALNKGATINLFNEGTAPSNWILDSTLFDQNEGDDLVIHADKLVIGTVTVNIDASAKGGKIAISRKDGDVYAIDMSKNAPILKLMRADAERWNSKGGVSIDNNVKRYADAGSLDEQSNKYVPIANYVHSSKQVGTAFYDVANKRMLFTNITSSNYNQVFDKVSALQNSWNGLNHFKFKETASRYYKHGDGRNTGGYRVKREYHVELLDRSQFQELQNKMTLLRGGNSQFTELQTKITALRQQQTSLEGKLTSIVNSLLEWDGPDGVIFREKLGTSDIDLSKLKPSQADKLAQSVAWSAALIEMSQFYNSLKSFGMMLKLGLNPAGEAMIGAVVGNLIYYYNPKHKLLWTADALTGELNTQYLPDILSGAAEKMNLYQDGNQVYVKFNTVFNDQSKGERTYLIKGNKMELIAASSNVHTRLKELAKREETTSLAIWNSETNTVHAMPVLESSLVVVYDIDSNGNVSNRRWLRSTGNKREKILAYLPASKKNRESHLVLVGAMSKVDNTEVFYFFDSAENTLYRQEGGAVLENETQRKSIQAVEINSVTGIKVIDGHLFTTMSDGAIYEVFASGRLTFVAVNEVWLKDQGKNWWKSLKTLGEDKTVGVHGLSFKDTDGKDILVWAWYMDGKLAISTDPTAGDSLAFVGINATLDLAYFFNEAKGELYKQQAYTDPLALFDDHFALKGGLSGTLTKILAEEKYSAASMRSGKIELLTEEGLIFNVNDSEALSMMGASDAWMKAHENDLSASINTVANKWETAGFSWQMGSSMILTRFDNNDLLLLGSTGNDTLAPILLNRSELVVLSGGLGQDTYNINLSTPNNLTSIRIDNYSLDQAVDTLRLTVNNINDVTISHNRSEDKLLFDYKSSAIVTVENVSKSSYNHMVLAINYGKKTANYSIAALASLLHGKIGSFKDDGGVEVSGHNGSDTYDVDLAKAKLKVFIDNLATRDNVMDILNLKVNDINKVKAKRKGYHLVLDDDQNEATGDITINNVFGLNKSKYDHMKLVVATEGSSTSKKEYQVAALVSGIDQLSNYNNASEYYSLVDILSKNKV